MIAKWSLFSSTVTYYNYYDIVCCTCMNVTVVVSRYDYFTVTKEQQHYLKKLEDLMMDKETVDIQYLKVFLVGPPGVGKTTTLDRLLKTIENICSASENDVC